MTFTNDPIASSIVTDVAHAKAAGFATSNIKGIFDLGADQPDPDGVGETDLDVVVTASLAPTPKVNARAPAVTLTGVSKRHGDGPGGGGRPAGHRAERGPR